MLIPLTPCYLFINMAEGFLWLRWVTKGSAEPQLGFFMLQGETSVLHPTEGFGWSCRNRSHLFIPPGTTCTGALRAGGEAGQNEDAGHGKRGSRKERRGGRTGGARRDRQPERGRRWKEGVRGEARARELPLSLESGFSDGNGGVSSSPWTMAPFAPLPAGTKEREDAAGEPRSAPPAPPGLLPLSGRSRAARPGPAGHQNCLEEC